MAHTTSKWERLKGYVWRCITCGRRLLYMVWVIMESSLSCSTPVGIEIVHYSAVLSWQLAYNSRTCQFVFRSEEKENRRMRAYPNPVCPSAICTICMTELGAAGRLANWTNVPSVRTRTPLLSGWTKYNPGLSTCVVIAFDLWRTPPSSDHEWCSKVYAPVTQHAKII